MNKTHIIVVSVLAGVLAGCSGGSDFTPDEDRFVEEMREVFPDSNDQFNLSLGQVYCESDMDHRTAAANGMINAGASVEDTEEFILNVHRYLCEE